MQSQFLQHNMHNMYDAGRDIRNFKILLHAKVYPNTAIISTLVATLNGTDLFNAEFDPISNTIKARVKRTNMRKKHSGYIHETSFYTNIIMPHFITNMGIYSADIYQVYRDNQYEFNLSHLKYSELISDPNYLSMLYCSLFNVVTLLDNIIEIRL